MSAYHAAMLDRADGLAFDLLADLKKRTDSDSLLAIISLMMAVARLSAVASEQAMPREEILRLFTNILDGVWRLRDG